MIVMKPKPTGFGRYTREEHGQKVKAGKNWHEDLRLSDLKKAKERLENGNVGTA